MEGGEPLWWDSEPHNNLTGAAPSNPAQLDKSNAETTRYLKDQDASMQRVEVGARILGMEARRDVALERVRGRNNTEMACVFLTAVVTMLVIATAKQVLLVRV
ncbi:hypothetical protein B0T16DRAFT_394045 [Cercophora newfieldiana]|uniref:Uncharacterized protein n=1 Tax=Cercophora newfieldiana TaxID=92897 RepID=A0AA40CK28_9PEZI|nr:hypothetical protein B0T16DRAFT_394045 [Cercophora newfieldiana]